MRHQLVDAVMQRQMKQAPHHSRDWLGDLPGIDSDTVIEQAIPLTGYNQVLSMIWLP